MWHSIWGEPRPADPPPIGRLDWLLVGVLAIAALIEGIARPGLVGQPFVTGLAVALMPALVWRRNRPLLMCVIGFAVAGLLSALAWATATDEIGLYSMMAVLILLYSLVRWGSGRDIVLGLVCVAISAGFGLSVTSAGPAEVIGSVLLLLLFVAFATVFRYRAALWDRQQRAVRNHERLALARELHDTVAHHVSAIAVQAQAGGVVVGTQPDQASGIFAAIESEASLTLAEMRAMVRVLRDDQADAYAPRLGVTALTGLVRSDSTPAVEVSLTGSLAGLPPAVDAAVYRIAQEALTNALRHARNATRVVIELRAEGDVVRVRVVDDGLPASRAGVEHGFGLPGMTERAHMLGGSMRAGPGADRGWVVEAVLPARGLT